MRSLTPFAILALAAAAQVACADDTAVPAPSPAPVPAGAYAVDKAHTSLLFKVSHLGFSTFTGRFTRLDAKLAFDPKNPAASSVSVAVDPKSISTDNAPAGFLDELAGQMFLDTGRFPDLKFVSRAVEDAGHGNLRIRGELTLHGVTRALTLEARYNGGYAGHAYEPNARVGFSARGTFKRSDFGISMGIPTAENHYFGVGDDVQVQLETEFTGPPLELAAR